LNKCPLVSVVIPAYNCEQYIKATVLSVIDQTYKNIEIIIIDDGSSDATGAVCKSLANEYDNIIYIYESNGGVSRARNIGLNKCTGEYICFLDGDDLWPNNKVAAQVEYLENNINSHFICGNYVEVSADFKLAQNHQLIITQQLDPQKSGWVYCKQLKGLHIHIITLMFRKELIDEVYFDEMLNIAEDYDLWLRIMAKYQISFLDACLAYYRRHSSSIMTKPQKECYKAIVLERNVKKFGLKCKSGEELTTDEFRLYLYDAWFSHGYVLYHTGKLYGQCMKAQYHCLKIKPFAFSSWKYLLASMAMFVISKFY